MFFSPKSAMFWFKVMMLSHQQMGHVAAKTIGEHDAAMDSFVISQAL